ncbi:hypothetical protein PN36_02360 [Candidatus Thiomargarita nelsonii]|uniref:Secreted protein n=1 Tax=Candidatus Thiomargarita nelsonii TaxID=1003181 RepID=A0A0A6P4E2_9GAMM|nr:hypothetical protein PN36_02360 [Candidatus Thiomargarita nelsonii]
MLRLPLIFLTTLISVAQAADMVVIHSDEIQLFPRGQLLDSQTAINLPADANITVVFSSGGVQSISGPYQGRLEDPLKNKGNKGDDTLVTSLADFLKTRETVRGILQLEKIWLIDISTQKRYFCIAPSERVILWRPESKSYTASRLLITHKKTGQKARLKWPAYQARLPWPRYLPITYGEIYTIALTTYSRTTSKELVLYQVPDSLPTNSHKVVWMVGRGCIPQANMLLAGLR